ncbi:MAG: lipoate--protein ligase family protein [Limisphaerales bacterium]
MTNRSLQLLDLTLPTPAENLACDEALLDDCEARGGSALRFWESTTPFVVVGYANAVASEVNLPACDAAQVPVLRRCSGGGTVVQGPGCLNYALVLEIADNPALATVSGANQFILRRNAAALSSLLDELVELCGDTDLVWRGRKFSGNAQRRRKTHLLFHGTVLFGFDTALVEKFLPLPTRQPAYREARAHQEFIGNLPLASAAVKHAFAEAWSANEELAAWPEERTRRLVRERYALAEWNRIR